MKTTAIILAALALAAPCCGQATLAKFNRVKDGMTFAQVKEILGSPDKEIVRVEYEGHSESAYQWDGPGGNGVACIGFVNGKVSGRSQALLE